MMPRAKLNDKWFRFLGIPLIALMGHIIFFNRNQMGEERFGFWGIYLLSLAETMLLWETNRLVILHFRKRLPGLPQTVRRITYIFVCCTLLTIVIRTLNIYLYDKTLLWGYRFPLEGYLHSIFVSILFVFLIGGAYEAIYYFKEWKDAAVETESLKRENLQSQFDSLKAQISPHFLFNSLGSLSSLIDENPKRAQDFVNAMAHVYRYLLQSNEKPLVTLGEEIEFLHAYADMLRTRFPDGLQVKMDINPALINCLLPPLTLQMLLENAVKHNAVLPSQPLNVHIFANEEQGLVVENNLQPKTSAVASNKLGLHNIISKYRLLNQPEVTVRQSDEKFIVTIPLIKNSVHAGIDRGR